MTSRSVWVALLLATAFVVPGVFAGSDPNSDAEREVMCINMVVDGTQQGLLVAYTLSDAIGVALGTSFNEAGVYAEAMIVPSLCVPSDPIGPIARGSPALPGTDSPTLPLTP